MEDRSKIDLLFVHSGKLEITFGVSMTEQLHLKIVNQKQTIEEELSSAISENILIKKLCLE